MKNSNKINELISEMEKISEIEKCLTCQCFYGTLLEFKDILEKVKGKRELEERLFKIIDRAKVTHECLGCDPCYPVPVSNALHEILGEGKTPVCGPVCKPVVLSIKKKPPSWPVEHGEYIVGNPDSLVAISTLGSDELAERIAGSTEKDMFTIIGKTHTENIGIEKIVKNTISNPYIRFIILCGKDTKGHFAGQSLLSLFHEGVNHDKRIIGSEGKRPVIKNLEFSEIEHFRKQVEVIDLIGTEDIKRIKGEVDLCKEKNPGRFERTIVITKAPQLKARRPEKLVLDPSGFFIIYPKKEEGRIYLEHYKADGTLNEIIEGDDPVLIASTAIEQGLLSRLDHAAYLGRELQKAHLSVIYGFPYTQDRAP